MLWRSLSYSATDGAKPGTIEAQVTAGVSLQPSTTRLNATANQCAMQLCHQIKGKMADFQLRNVGQLASFDNIAILVACQQYT